MKTTIKNLSKFISLVLRHQPVEHGISIDDAGWAETDQLIECVQEYKDSAFDLSVLEDVVQNNDKNRFEFNDDESKIRARQGHSVKVDLGYSPAIPPEILYHGTNREAFKEIWQSGIKKMNRHAVHLTEIKSQAYKRGGLVVPVRAKKMYIDGYKFYVTPNDVWLTENVPTDYIQVPF